EFYWKVERGQRTSNRDFACSKGLLSLEKTPTEVTWSAGDKLASDTVAKAFGLTDKADLLKRDDPGPFVAAKGTTLKTWLIIAFIVFIVISELSDCSGSPGGNRSSGGSYGGFSTGGGHK
ncbi:MAG: DUF4178 domain-containing protein, partial [Giesbergeria sp.]